MFIGSINSKTRAFINALSAEWPMLPVYVGCSGNFTIERILWSSKRRELHSNDISLYSGAVGTLLAGDPFRIEVADDRYDWLKPWIDADRQTVISALLVLSEMLKAADRTEPYFVRMWDAYRLRFEDLISQTRERVLKALGDLRLTEEGEPKHDGWVPISSIIGTEKIPATAAQTIKRAVELMRDKGDLTQKNLWQALEYLAADYLAGVPA